MSNYDEPIDEHDYLVKVFTGDEPGAGTDAAVYIVIVGKKFTSEPMKLKKSTTHSNKFERNQTDLFTLKMPDIGEIQKIKIWHNNKGFGPDWYLDKVIIDCPSLGLKYLFPCNRWLAKKADCTVECELKPKKI